MNCSFGPYQITSNLQQNEEFVFVDAQKTRQVVAFYDCQSFIHPPCPESIVLNDENNCPGCKIRWYECPTMGRQYTIFPTPCGVTITSFEDGLVVSGSCDATKFGSQHFCFGKIYSKAGEFDASDESSVTFDFDGNTFTVKGNSGVCPDMIECSECDTGDASIESFAELPDAPSDISSPDTIPEEQVTADDVSETEVIPLEGRTTWPWVDPVPMPFGEDTLCEPEKAIVDWAGGTNPLPGCVSNDNPSIATLPSGHTIIAFEDRRSNGITKISVAIFPSSIGENIKYHRKLGKGTFLNNLVVQESVGTFEVFDEIDIALDSSGAPLEGENIGFLTGPTGLSGKIYTITKITRTIDRSRVKNTFNFLVTEAIEFPDKNHAYDVEWFLTDDIGTTDLPSSNVVNILDLPAHKDFAGVEVPVAHPSIAVASNNVMTSFEQNVYIAYQAFESDNWRIYIREIVLGRDADENPIYKSPYTFGSETDPGQTSVTIMGESSNAGEISQFSHNTDPVLIIDTLWSDHFAGAFDTLGQVKLEDTNGWIARPLIDPSVNSTQPIQPMVLCRDDGTITTGNSPHCTCTASCNGKTCRAIGGIDYRFLSPDSEESESLCREPASSSENTISSYLIDRRFSKPILPNSFNPYPDGSNALAEGGGGSYFDTETLYSIHFTDIDRQNNKSAFTLFSGKMHDDFPVEEASIAYVGFPFYSFEILGPTDITGQAEQAFIVQWKGAGGQPHIGLYQDSSTGRSDTRNFLLLGNNSFRVTNTLVGRHRIIKVYVSNSHFTDENIINFRVEDMSVHNVPQDLQPGHGAFISDSWVDVNPQTFTGDFGFGYFTNGNKISMNFFVVRSLSGHPEIVYEDFFEQDLSSFGTHYLNPVTVPVSDNWSTVGIGSSAGGDFDSLGGNRTFHSLSGPDVFSKPHAHPSSLDLGWIGGLSFRAAAEMKRDATPGVDYPTFFNANMYIRYSRLLGDHRLGDGTGDGTWPTVWFLLRQDTPLLIPPSSDVFEDIVTNIADNWSQGWRVRVRHFDQAGVRKWRISLYDGSSTGSADAVPVDFVEINATAVTKMEDWTPNPKIPGTDNFSSHTDAKFPSLKCTIVEGQDGDENATNIRVYFAASSNSTFDELDGSPVAGSTQSENWTLLAAFVAARNHVGKHYDFLFSSGSPSNEFNEVSGEPLKDFDFRSSIIVDQIRFGSFSIPGDATVSDRRACCRAAGGWDCAASHECVSPDVWHSTTQCIPPIDCSLDFAVGAACRSDGVCVDNITESEAAVQGFGTCTDCEWQQGKNCIINDVNYRNCPPAVITGRCCRPFDSFCSNVTLERCQEFWGNTLAAISPGVECESFGGHPGGWQSPECQFHIQNKGACCTPTGCVITEADNATTSSNSSYECKVIGGIFLGRYTDCVNNFLAGQGGSCDETENTTQGACCVGSTCSSKTVNDCASMSGFFHGFGTDCSPNPCSSSLPMGACCYNNGTCLDVPESSCMYVGTWFYDSLCSDSPCPTPDGACCDPVTGSCSDDVTEFDCSESGRTYQGHGSLCSLATCPQPAGACCNGPNCTDGLTEDECVASGGIFRGNFTNCVGDICTDLEDPYGETGVIFKPEDLWTIEVSDNKFVTRVLYHMREERVFSSSKTGGTLMGNLVDFMFVVDHNGNMESQIANIASAIPGLDQEFKAKGFDTKFGFIAYGRSAPATPIPSSKNSCSPGETSEECIFDALQRANLCRLGNSGSLSGVDVGFTRDANYLKEALNCWGSVGGEGTVSPWAAINFSLDVTKFPWRNDASKFIFLATNSGDTSEESSCNSYSTENNDAVIGLDSNNVVLIPAVTSDFQSVFEETSRNSGWGGTIFDIDSTDFEAIFKEIAASIDSVIRIEHSTVIERAKSGTESTFLKKAESIITYDGDLSDLWTFSKGDFGFQDSHAPFPGSSLKDLSNFPFDLADGKTYGIDPVHIQGIPSNWVSFGSEGDLNYNYPNVGSRGSSTSDPILISTNSTRPKVFVNNRNQVIVAYENYATGNPQIEIKGTGDFHQDSITGPKASRIQRFLTPADFAYNHVITLFGDGMNQICDFVIDNSDITHIVWQSNAEGRWEIYYANSGNLFDPVKITNANSKSLHPSISVDENGSIFVVYHDDRFGPFEIMLASKDEERVIPLIEQDAYLASMFNKYTHYTNIIPLILDNPSSGNTITGQFWGTKLSTGPGNDSENSVYKLNSSTGLSADGQDLGASGQSFIALSSVGFYGVNSTGILSKIGSVLDNNSIEFSTSTIGIINLDISGFTNHEILDMDIDQFDRIWVLIYEEPEGGGVARFRIEQIDINAQTVSSSSVLDATSAVGALTITSDNTFYVLGDDSGIKLFKSDYPLIDGSAAQFSFSINGTTTITPQSMSRDSLDKLFVVTDTNDLYSIDKDNASATFEVSLTSSSGSETSLPVGTTSGIAFQKISSVSVGVSQTYHVRVDFYANIAFEGEVFLSIDSRTNLEAFINEETTEDPYLFGLSAGGILLNPDEIGIVFFDSGGFVPGFSRLSQPYTFEPNQTYFPRVFLIDPNGNPRESGIAQPNSFSCTKCSRFGNNNFNSSSCSYSFVSANTSEDTDLFFNYNIDFYADPERQHLIRRFDLTPDSEDLQYAEIDNNPAISLWQGSGLLIKANSSVLVQVYPALDPVAGFLCGVQYTVGVNQCFDQNDQCANFSPVDPGRWDSVFVGDPDFQTIETLRSGAVSMTTFQGDIIMAWVSNTESGGGGDGIGSASSIQRVLKYGRYNGSSWEIQTVSIAPSPLIGCSLAVINGLPAILYNSRPSGEAAVSDVIMFNGSIWAPYSSESKLTANFASTLRSLANFNNEPIFVFPEFDTAAEADGRQWIPGQPFGRSKVFDNRGNLCGTQGSCDISIAIINGTPSVVYHARNHIIYAEWNESTQKFGPLETIAGPDKFGNGESIKSGRIGIDEADGPVDLVIGFPSDSSAQLLYNFSKGSGRTVFDSSGNEFDGSLGSSVDEDVFWAGDGNKNGAQFRGESVELDIIETVVGDEISYIGPSAGPPARLLTVNLWVYRHANTGTKDLWIIGTGKDAISTIVGWVLLINSDGQMQVLSGTLISGRSVWSDDFGTNFVPIETWTMVTMTLGTTDANFYINGSLIFTLPGIAVLDLSGQERLYIGEFEATDATWVSEVDGFFGSVGRVQIFNQEKDATFISDLFESESFIFDRIKSNKQPAIAYLIDKGANSELIYRRFTGMDWESIPTLAGTKPFGNKVDLKIINGQPVIAYTVITLNQVNPLSELWIAVFNGSEFDHDLLAENIGVASPFVEITIFNNQPAVTVAANPFKVYLFKQFSSSLDSDLNPGFFCDCASKIFTNRLTHLNEIDRWESSANGFADTRITDSVKDSTKPVIKTRSTGAAIILWEDDNITANCPLPPCIRAATFRNTNQDQLRSSGTKSWFDYDFGISGQDPDLSLDLYDRVNTIYEKPVATNPSGFHGMGISASELPENELFGKVCDFAVGSKIGNEQDSPSSDAPTSLCDLSSLESNVITFDQFISRTIVRKIKVKNEFVEYYTYNASGDLTPIVSTCNVILEIHGTPEIVAVRIRNEDNATFSNWCAWSPQVSDFVMEKKHKISGSSGIKQICIQAMTYSGITSEFCIPIIADYETVVFETNFYKNTEEIVGFKDYSVDPDPENGIIGEFTAGLDAELVKLPSSDGLAVANISPTDGNPELPTNSKVLVEIIPNQTFDGTSINFDVIQQGNNDLFSLEAVKGKNNVGRVVYRGDFMIEKEDNTFNADGLARVSPTFPNACESADQQSIIADSYSRDNFNVLGQNTEVEAATVTDPLTEFRQGISGRIGVTLDIRGTEDPYLIFGDPNYTLKKTDGQRLGVPFTTAETEIQTGETGNPGDTDDGPGGG